MNPAHKYRRIHLWRGRFWKPARIKKILHLGSPVFLGMVVQNLVNVTDTIMIGYMGKYRGDIYPQLILDSANGLAALATATIFVWMIAGLFSSINVGTQAMVSRREGEGRKEAAGFILFNSMTVGFLTGIFASIISSVYIVPAVFPSLVSNDEVARLGVGYCVIRFYSVPAWVATFGIKAFWDGIGKTHIHMVAAVVMTVLNFVLNYILIFGIPEVGIEPMGVMGAAWGSTIGTYIGFVIVFAWLFKHKYASVYHYFRKIKLDWVIIKEIYRVSLPSGIANIAIMSGFLGFTFVAAHLDTEEMQRSLEKNAALVIEDLSSVEQAKSKIKSSETANGSEIDKEVFSQQVSQLRSKVQKFQQEAPALLAAAKADGGVFFNEPRAKLKDRIRILIDIETPEVLKPVIRPISFNTNAAATTAVINLAMLTFIGILGFGQATATLVGQSLGRRKPGTAQKFAFEAVTLLAAAYAVIGLFFVVFPRISAAMFTPDPFIIEMAVSPVRIWGVCLLFAPAAMILPQALFAAGQSMFVMIVEMILHFTCLVPLGIVFGLVLDGRITGLWLAAGLYVTSLALIMAVKFAGHSWMSSKLKG